VLAVLLLLLCGEPVRAFNCLTQFSALAESEDVEPNELVAGTYADLLQRLGSSLSPATLKKMAKGDPFHAPEQSGLDVLLLNRKLREFRELIEAGGWSAKSFEPALAEWLERRSGELGQQAGKIEQQVAQMEQLKLSWPFRRGSDPGVGEGLSPNDGLWLNVLPERVGQKAKASLFDLRTRAFIPLAKIPTGSAHFSADGKKLLWADEGRTLKEFPIVNGVPDFKHPREIGEWSGNGQFKKIHPTSDARIVFGDLVNLGEPAFRVDLVRGEVTEVSFDQFIERGDSVMEWGVIPGSTDLFVLRVRGSDGLVGLVRLKVSATGDLTEIPDARLARANALGKNSEISSVHLSPDGAYLLTWHDDGKSHVMKDGAVQPIPFQLPAGAAFTFAPHKGKLPFLLKGEGQEKSVLGIWDIENNKLVHSKTISEYPGALEVRYSSDGEKLYLTWDHGGATSLIYVDSVP